MIVLYILFAISVFFPFYTYALYPVILRLLKEKVYSIKTYEPTVSVIVVGENAENKIKNILQFGYPCIEIFNGKYSDAYKAKGEIVLFTDTKTRMDLNAIEQIVKPFADERIGAVVGQQTNPDGNSSFWEYENLVKQLESRIGCVSGANESLFAVRKKDMPEVPERVLNKPFYIVTRITEDGKDVVFEDSAKTYEQGIEGTNFRKHVEDAAGYWQALRMFPKLLIGHSGCFVYVSHRVMKWLVWLNMIMLLICSGVLALYGSAFMFVLFVIQIIGYITVLLLGNRSLRGPIGRLLEVGHYFVMLNIAYFIGMFK